MRGDFLLKTVTVKRHQRDRKDLSGDVTSESTEGDAECQGGVTGAVGAVEGDLNRHGSPGGSPYHGPTPQ